jgi:hypothetical protein
MPGLVPGIHVLFPFLDDEDVDGRDKPGHDGALTASSDTLWVGMTIQPDAVPL